MLSELLSDHVMTNSYRSPLPQSEVEVGEIIL
jgi:hypothetical protein